MVKLVLLAGLLGLIAILAAVPRRVPSMGVLEVRVRAR
jgi:hypothetical protein